jgi:precorrin-3B C17-methyltransferase
VTAGRLFVVGLGPGDRSLLTPQAAEALRQAEVVVGYEGYFAWIEELVRGKDCLRLPLGQERERSRLAVDRAAAGSCVAVISSGDPGIYAMASILLETLPASRPPEVTVVPGVSALTAAAALLGAPLGHDFAAISLSDLLTPWAVIEKRLTAVAAADFVLAVFNPKSQRRDWQLRRAQEILLTHREPQTPVGIVRHAFRPGQSVVRTTLAAMADAEVDMFSILFVGNSTSRWEGDHFLTPRGYDVRAAEEGR